MRLSDAVFTGLAAGLVVSVAVAGRPAAGPLTSASVSVVPLPLSTFGRHATLGHGENLAELLRRLGVPPAELPTWIAAAAPHLRVRALPVGLEAFATGDHHGVLRVVRMLPDVRHAVILERCGDTVTGRREVLPVEAELVVVRGVVVSSLFAAVTAAGEGDEVALALADLFQWDIDFHREVQPGDTFALLVERLCRDGRRVAYGRVVAAEYVGGGRRHVAVAFADAKGRVEYFDAAGRPLEKQFLRAPLRFSRVSSRFSASRLHPVLGRRMPHWGVDYAAPVGTPVMATAAGVVSFVGTTPGAGLTVELAHRNGYTTGYLHLSQVARGVAVGARVEQGQVIGFVGSSGLSTGPHLDYRVRRHGSYVNPLRLVGEPVEPLAGGRLVRFRRWAEEVLPLLGEEGAVGEAVATALRQAAPGCFDG